MYKQKGNANENLKKQVFVVNISVTKNLTNK